MRPARSASELPSLALRAGENCDGGYPMKCDLAGKVSLVTGAAAGIGLASADRLAAKGGRVVYTDVNAAGVEQAAARSPAARALRLDVTRPDEIDAVVRDIVATWGSLDI